MPLWQQILLVVGGALLAGMTLAVLILCSALNEEREHDYEGNT